MSAGRLLISAALALAACGQPSGGDDRTEHSATTAGGAAAAARPSSSASAARGQAAHEPDPARFATGDERPARLPSTEATRDPLAEERALRDPSADDWEVEELDHQVHAWWDRLLEGAEGEDLVAPTLALDPLVPALETLRAGVFQVERAAPGALRGERAGTLGAEDFAGEVARLLAPAEPGSGGLERAKVKVVGGERLEQGGARTEMLLELVWPPAEGAPRRQLRARWTARWEGEDPLRLAALEVHAFERTALAPSSAGAATEADGSVLFTDATRAVLGRNASFDRQLDVSLPRWSAVLDAALGTSVIGHEGLALGDADGDGLDDVYVCQPGGLPNLLYLRRPDGTAEDVSRAAGVDWLDASRSALFVDLDGDGDQDLVVEADPELLLMRNLGDARFELAGTAPAPATTSLSAADPDRDGDLDIYACAYMLPDEGERVPLPYHDADNGRRNTFLVNQASEGRPWSFVDATAAAGLDRNNRRYSFAAAWEDYDGDGDQDLYVANDFGRNNLFRNDTPAGGAPSFVDVAAELGVEDMAAGMGVTWADVDRDARPDLYVGNMFSSAGGRITYQRRFRDGAGDDTSSFRRHARGNTLFLNGPDGFEDVSEQAGVTMGRWSWGALFTDFENDGWPDLVVPNGFVTGPDTLDL